VIEKPLTDLPVFDKILNEVATFQTPKQMEQGTYSLKTECWAEFDRNFPHYTKVSQSNGKNLM
jgi:hypothetical protein